MALVIPYDLDVSAEIAQRANAFERELEKARSQTAFHIPDLAHKLGFISVLGLGMLTLGWIFSITQARPDSGIAVTILSTFPLGIAVADLTRRIDRWKRRILLKRHARALLFFGNVELLASERAALEQRIVEFLTECGGNVEMTRQLYRKRDPLVLLQEDVRSFLSLFERPSPPAA